MSNANTLPHPPGRDEQEFWDLITADRELLRAEFDAIIDAAWPAPLASGAGGPHRGNRPGVCAAPRSPARRAHPTAHRRQRSPPRRHRQHATTAPRARPGAPSTTRGELMAHNANLDFASSIEPGDRVVLHVRGEVDLSNADRLRERLLAEFARHPHLVLDLSKAMLYDGAALRALHAVHRAAERDRRQPPTLRGVRPLLAKALKATGMYTLFPHEAHPPFPLARTARPAALLQAA